MESTGQSERAKLCERATDQLNGQVDSQTGKLTVKWAILMKLNGQVDSQMGKSNGQL